MTSRYRHGYDFERKVSDLLEADGYEVVQARGSHGVADLWAMKPGQVLWVQVKKRNPLLSPADRKDLIDRARAVWAVPLVAFQPAPRKPVEFRQLTGYSPKAWQPWTSDEVAATVTIHELTE